MRYISFLSYMMQLNIEVTLLIHIMNL